MTGTTGSDYDAAAADLVVRTLRAVADATPVDPTPADVDLAAEVLPRAGRARPTRRARWALAGLVAGAAAVLVVVAVWSRVDGRVETAPSGQPSGETLRRPIAEERVVARGDADGRPWTLRAQPFEGGIVCLELTGSGGSCGSMPSGERPLGTVSYSYSSGSIEVTDFIYGVVAPGTTDVSVELADGGEVRPEVSGVAFGARFFVAAVPSVPEAVVVRDDAGEHREELDLGVDAPATRQRIPPR